MSVCANSPFLTAFAIFRPLKLNLQGIGSNEIFLGRILRPVFRYGVGCFPLGLHVLNVNRSREPVVVVKFHGIGQLHQKEGKPPHFNLDLLIPYSENSGVAVVHAGGIGIVDPCLAHRFDKFLLRNLSHAAHKSTAAWDRQAVFWPCRVGVRIPS